MQHHKSRATALRFGLRRLPRVSPSADEGCVSHLALRVPRTSALYRASWKESTTELSIILYRCGYAGYETHETPARYDLETRGPSTMTEDTNGYVRRVRHTTGARATLGVKHERIKGDTLLTL